MLENRYREPGNAPGIPKSVHCHEIQIISGRVILLVLAVWRAHQAAHRHVEAWRTVLPLVVAGWRERSDCRGRATSREDVLDGPIYQCASPARPDVRERSIVSDSGENEPAANPRSGNFVLR